MLVSNSQIHSLLELAPIGVIHSDGRGACIHANRKWLEITGATLAETLGHGWLAYLHADDLPRVMERWTNASQYGEEDAMEFRVRRPSGEIRFLKVSGLAAHSLLEVNAGSIGWVEDVTESQRRQYKFR